MSSGRKDKKFEDNQQLMISDISDKRGAIGWKGADDTVYHDATDKKYIGHRERVAPRTLLEQMVATKHARDTRYE